MKGRAADYLFLGVLAVIGLLFMRFVHRPQLGEVERIGRELREVQAGICKSEDFTRGLEDLERYLHEFEADLARLDRLVPTRTDVDVHVAEVSALVEACGLLATSIRPDAARPRGPVTAHPLNVKLIGGFDAMLDFLHRAESLPRHTRVTRLSILTDGAPRGSLLATVELTSYSVSPEGAS